MRFVLALTCVVLAVAAVNARGVSKNGILRTYNHEAKNKLFKPHPVAKASSAGDYIPCKRQITVYYDNSNDISSSLYGKLQDFVKNTAFSNFNNFERSDVGVYSASYIERKILGFLHNLDDVKEFVDEISQDTTGADFGFLFSDLVDNYDPTDLPRTIVLLVGQLTADDVKLADKYAEQIKKQGVIISIIGIQSSVDLKVLDKLADYANVFDLNSGVPSDIQDILHQAYCGN